MSKLMTTGTIILTDSITDLASVPKAIHKGVFVYDYTNSQLYFCYSGTTLTAFGTKTAPITSYNGLTLSGNGVPTIQSIKSIDPRTTDYAANSFLLSDSNSPLGIGLYEISVYASCTTAGTGTLDINIGFTDVTGAKVLKVISAMDLSATTVSAGVTVMIYTTGVDDITLNGDITVNSGAPAYRIYAVAKRISTT